MAVALRGPIRITDLVPEIIDAVELPRDGAPVMLRGYVNGRRCPSRIKAEVASVIQQNDLTGSYSFGAYLGQIRGILSAVVLGIEDDEADLLAGDDGPAGGLAILRLLGWWQADAVDEDDADPEVTGEESTLPTSSPNSRRSTKSARPNS